MYLLAEGVVLFWADVKVPEMLYENFSRKVQSLTTQAAFGRRSGPKTLLNSFVTLEISLLENLNFPVKGQQINIDVIKPNSAVCSVSSS